MTILSGVIYYLTLLNTT